MTSSFRLSLLLTALTVFLTASCDSNAEDSCLTVTPDEAYTLSGTAQTTNFLPATKTYTVRNTCDSNLMLSVEEEVRWLDVEIDSYGDAEAGPLAAGANLEVRIEVRYGTDNSERLDQLAPGTYGADLRFRDTSNNTEVVQAVNLTVSMP